MNQSEWGIDLPEMPLPPHLPPDEVPSPANGEYREPMGEARRHGVEARNAKRLERAQQRADEDPAVYFCPASGEMEMHPGGGFDVCCDRPQDHQTDIKWLTKLCHRLGKAEGHKEALEEAAKAAEEMAAGVVNPEKLYNEAFIHACGVVARRIREIGDQP